MKVLLLIWYIISYNTVCWNSVYLLFQPSYCFTNPLSEPHSPANPGCQIDNRPMTSYLSVRDKFHSFAISRGGINRRCYSGSRGSLWHAAAQKPLCGHECLLAVSSGIHPGPRRTRTRLCRRMLRPDLALARYCRLCRCNDNVFQTVGSEFYRAVSVGVRWMHDLCSFDRKRNVISVYGFTLDWGLSIRWLLNVCVDVQIKSSFIQRTPSRDYYRNVIFIIHLHR